MDGETKREWTNERKELVVPARVRGEEEERGGKREKKGKLAWRFR